ncbi:LysR family transcriptional regulator [Pelagibius sp. Alg239-R121]|uniref:LysR family transcriptional regulator n=1 Tax=Pelagibius sp. Alg239-R121 TaxID=2993448 RepID=UPI0024A618E7|nr:LysR family transcriptional regulator [Pelagibius sp. Alg239-R121]
MNVTLQQLRYVVAAAEHGNLTQAASALSASQPSLSVAIRQIEEQSALPLFVRRRGSGVKLTAFGLEFVQRAKVVLDEAANLSEMAETGVTTSGRIVIGCFADLAPMFAPAIFDLCEEAQPGIEVEFREGGFDELSAWLSEAMIDLAVTYDVALSAEVERTDLARLRPYAMLPRGHRLAGNGVVSLRDLAQERLISTTQAHSWPYILELFRVQKLTPEVRMQTASLETQRSLIAHGYGVGIAYTRPKNDSCYDGTRLSICELAEETSGARVIAARLKNVAKTRTSQRIVERMATRLSRDVS